MNIHKLIKITSFAILTCAGLSSCVSSTPVAINTARVEALPKAAAAEYLNSAQAKYGLTQCEFSEDSIIFKTKDGRPVPRQYSDVEYAITQYGKGEELAIGADIIFPAPAILIRKMENICFFHMGWNLSGAKLRQAQEENLFDNLAAAFSALEIPRK